MKIKPDNLTDLDSQVNSNVLPEDEAFTSAVLDAWSTQPKASKPWYGRWTGTLGTLALLLIVGGLFSVMTMTAWQSNSTENLSVDPMHQPAQQAGAAASLAQVTQGLRLFGEQTAATHAWLEQPSLNWQIQLTPEQQQRIRLARSWAELREGNVIHAIRIVADANE